MQTTGSFDAMNQSINAMNAAHIRAVSQPAIRRCLI